MKILSGQFKNRQLKSPKGQNTRPTLSKVRGSIFDILQQQIEGTRFLDLFAGSGSMGIEALSRGANEAIFIEKDRNAASCIRENLTSLGIKALCLQMDVFIALKYLQKQKILFNLVYIDPPYALDIHPLLTLLPSILSPEGWVILEQNKYSAIKTDVLKKIDERRFGDTLLHFFIQN